MTPRLCAFAGEHESRFSTVTLPELCHREQLDRLCLRAHRIASLARHIEPEVDLCPAEVAVDSFYLQ